MKLIIVRHGQTEDNSKDIIMGQLHGKLSPLGLEQAKKIGERLKNEDIDLVFCSDLFRAKETLEPILKFHKNIPVIYAKELRERSVGVFEGGPSAKYHEFLETDKDNFSQLRPEKGESLQDQQERAIRFVRKIAEEHKDKTILLCTHGGWIRVFTAAVLGAKLEKAWPALKIRNASVSEFEVDEEKGFRIHLLNCTKHLE